MTARAIRNTVCAALALLLAACGGGGGGSSVPPGVEVYDTGLFPVDVVVGDFDGIGGLDVAVANQNDAASSVVTLFQNTGGALGSGIALASTTSLPTYSAISLATGKLTGDTRDDLVILYVDGFAYEVATSPDTVANMATTGAVDLGTDSYPQAVTLADFNGDTKLDMAVALSGTGYDRIDLLTGDGSGGFATAWTSIGAGALPWGVASGDLDGDLVPDLASVSLSGGGKMVDAVRGSDLSAIPSPIDPDTRGDADLAIADLDGDNIDDVVRTFDLNNTVGVFLSSAGGDLTTYTPYTVGTSPSDVAIGNVVGDASLDIVTADSGSNTVTILQGDGTGGFVLAETVSVPDAPAALAVGNLNGDAMDDILTVHPSRNWLSVILR